MRPTPPSQSFRLRASVCVAAVVTSLSCGGTQAPPPPPLAVTALPAAAADPMDAPLPLDPKVRHVRLDNGLEIFVRAHGKPEKRASLRLAVDVGSVLETDAERGLAHYVEHMAFNGTRLYEKQEFVDYMEKVGMKFGQHANASTSFDETIYMFEVPTDEGDVLEKGLGMLQQIASEITFDQEEVQRERGVVIEEWRSGRGAGMRVMEKILPTVFKGSRYAERLPIGTKDVLERATADDLKRFHAKWYRPDLMTVVVVGDFDPAVVEAKARALFGALAKPAIAPARVSFPVPEHASTLVATALDKELPSTMVGVLQKLPRRPQRSARDARRNMAESLFHGMLNARLQELTRSENPPFMFAGSSTGAFVRSGDVFSQMAAVKQDQIARGLDALTREVERADRHGFTATELARAKADTMRRMDARAKEEDKLLSASFAQEIVAGVLADRAIPGLAAQLALTKSLLPTISLEEVNGLARGWIAEKNRVILVQGPSTATVPSDTDLLAVFQRVQKENLAAYVDAVSAAPLVASLPPPGRVESERHLEEIGVTEWRLSNGATVFFKATDFKNDEVLVHAISPGGLSLVSDRDFPSARFASQIVTQSGWANFGPDELRKKLSGKIASGNPFIGEAEEGFEGRASPDDLETLFELMHLAFTAPRRDPAVFAAWQSRLGEQLARTRLQPESVFFDRKAEILYGNHLRRRPLVAGDEKKVSLDKAFEIYKQRFADPGDFTFGFVGSIDAGKLRALVVKYLASLPARGGRERWRDTGARPVTGKKSFEVAAGIEPKSTLHLTFSSKGKWTREGNHQLHAALAALDIKLREVIREDLGATYGVRVFGDFARRPIEWSRGEIGLSCDPAKLTKIRAAIDAELAKARREGLPATYVEKVQAAERRQLEVAMKTNGWWLEGVLDHYRYGTDPRLVLDQKKLIDGLSVAVIKKAMAQHFAGRNVVVGMLKPAPTAPTAPTATAAP